VSFAHARPSIRLCRPAAAGSAILIVGDPALSRGLMRTVLERLGHAVTYLGQGDEAQAAMADGRYDLVLVARLLGDGPGAGFVRALRAADSRHRRVRVIMFGDAGSGERGWVESGSAGAQHYLGKPISIGRLLAAIRSLLRPVPNGRRQSLGNGMTTPVDTTRLIDLTDGDSQLERELGSLFLSTANRYMEAMRQALETGADWSGPAHSLKGASANLGAVAMADLAARAEQEPPSAVRLEELGKCLAETRSFFAERLGDEAGQEFRGGK